MQLPQGFELAQSLPASGCSRAEAERYVRALATSHYENFHVVSWLLPRRLHQHLYNLYAYCRWADNLGDEVADKARALELLDWWERELDLCYQGKSSHPVFVALAPTIQVLDIPSQPFRDLLTAFRQDQTVQRYETWDDVIKYCRHSADPVGRLVLYLCGYRDPERQKLSDYTCTALQLANFWQDVSRDLDKGRIYIPLDRLRRHGLAFSDIEARRFDSRYVALMKDLVASTRDLFSAGLPLAATLDGNLRVDVELFSRGGLAVLKAIEAMGYDTLHHRPSIGKLSRVNLLIRALFGQLRARLAERPKSESAADAAQSRASASKAENAGVALVESYKHCRDMARRAASNFYYAFYMLPRPKRDALCALYAFMRLVDDVSDSFEGDGGTGTGVTAKQAAIAQWRILLDRAANGDTSGHAILPAFADTLRRYHIPARYLHDLISGAEMDLTEMSYATFERLREYCYRVAGTVGLTCLHVFGFHDPHAPELAERLGIAFQLTNVLRDIQADLALGRVYLPAEDMTRFGVSTEDLERGVVTPNVRELLRFEANRAWHFYEEGTRLMGRIDTESRAALWALARIYSSLLARIEDRDYDVFSSRVRLTGAEKARILVRARLGWWSESDVLEKRDRHRRRTGGPLLGRRAG